MNQQYPMRGISSLIASQGRGGDSTLVHMSPDEVQVIKEFAEANGLPLTYNPQTGLPEAFWLTDVLKGIWSGAKKIGTAAIQNPQITSALLGTAYGAVKGDLQKGTRSGYGSLCWDEAARRDYSSRATHRYF